MPELRPDLIKPNVYAAFEGHSVTFTCTSDEEPNWTKSGFMSKMPTYVDAQDNVDTLHSIIIPNLMSRHTGQYNCHGMSNGTTFKAVAQLYVGSEYYNGARQKYP